MAKASMKNLTLLLSAGLLATLLSTACSDDEETGSGPEGGGAKGGSAGTAGTGGGGTGGRGGTSGTGGTGGRGGTAGSGGTAGGPTDGGPDGDGGGCPPGEVLLYETLGCEAKPRCGRPEGDACVAYACSCRGTTIGGCGYYVEPYRHLGPCSDGGDSGPDSGHDSGPG
jgi:hypothetical protein